MLLSTYARWPGSGGDWGKLKNSEVPQDWPTVKSGNPQPIDR
jgi:hypothetical protein